LAEQYEIQVNYQDVENMTRSEILSYFNYQIPSYGDMMDNMLERILSDKKEVNKRFEALMDQRILERAAEHTGKEMIDTTKEDFEGVLKAYQESKNPAVEEVATEELENDEAEV
jgi:DNA-binding ferritin-like protein